MEFHNKFDSPKGSTKFPTFPTMPWLWGSRQWEIRKWSHQSTPNQRWEDASILKILENIHKTARRNRNYAWLRASICNSNIVVTVRKVFKMTKKMEKKKNCPQKIVWADACSYSWPFFMGLACGHLTYQSWSGKASPVLILFSCHLEKPSFKASLIHGCRQFSYASGMVNQLLLRVFCSGHDSSSSFTNKANIAALHDPSGLNSSWRVLLLKW